LEQVRKKAKRKKVFLTLSPQEMDLKKVSFFFGSSLSLIESKGTLMAHAEGEVRTKESCFFFFFFLCVTRHLRARVLKAKRQLE
jgi:hypothetical protein